MNTVDGWSTGKTLAQLLPGVETPADFFAEEVNKGHYRELEKLLRESGGNLSILEIGPGIGKSSIYMASLGHRVSIVEPSQEACRILNEVSEKFRLPIQIYQGPGEVIEQIIRHTDDRFDLCIFNASLHHCDDPVRALQCCRSVLREGGRVVLLNEPILKPFRTKQWYFRKLETNPQAMGHYGGNEHIYYAWEYPRMLRKAGLGPVALQPSGMASDIRYALSHMATVNQKGNYIYSEKKLVQHSLWALLLSQALKVKPLRWLLTRGSLVPLTFSASQ